MLTAVRRSPAHCSSRFRRCRRLAGAARPAAFIEDSSATLQTHNIYLNRDFREGTAQSSAKSGPRVHPRRAVRLHRGTVGVGSDALGMLGVKLDSGGGRAGTDLLPVQDDGGTRTSSAAWA